MYDKLTPLDELRSPGSKSISTTRALSELGTPYPDDDRLSNGTYLAPILANHLLGMPIVGMAKLYGNYMFDIRVISRFAADAIHKSTIFEWREVTDSLGHRYLRLAYDSPHYLESDEIPGWIQYLDDTVLDDPLYYSVFMICNKRGSDLYELGPNKVDLSHVLRSLPDVEYRGLYRMSISL